MIGSIVVAHLGNGEVIVGKMELRGIYEPAYGFWIVGEHGEVPVDWTKLESLLRVGARVAVREMGTEQVVRACDRPPSQEPAREPDGLAIST